MSAPVLVRADGSAVLGMGNITRSLSIAEVFLSTGTPIVFAARDLDARVRAHVEAMGCTYHPLPQQLSVDDDVAVTRALATTLGAEYIVVDLANPEATHDLATYSAYLQQIAHPFKLVVVDDLTRAVFPRGVVINPNTEVTRGDYDVCFDPVFLFGPHYAILRSAYRDAARSKTYNAREIEHVAISLGGGVVASELLAAVLDAIRIAFGTSLHVELVTGLGDAERLRDQLAPFKSVNAIPNLPSLRDLLLRSDLAFVSGGVTKYEAAATGTPMIIVPSIDHQEAWGASFARTGAAFYAGNVGAVTADGLAAICDPMRDPATRRAMGERGATLVDGRGALRIVESALALQATERP